MLTVFVLFVLKYFFYCDFLVCLFVLTEKDDPEGAFSGHALELVSILSSEFSVFFLGSVFFLFPFEKLIGFGPELFDGVSGFGRNEFEGFALGD